MKVPVFEQHDGNAYNSFIKVTEAALVPTRGGIVTEHRVTRLTWAGTRRDYTPRSVPCNPGHVSRATLERLLMTLYPYQGGKLPLYQLDSRAYNLALEMGVA